MTLSRILGLIAALSLVAMIVLQVVISLGMFWITNLELVFGSCGIALAYGVLEVVGQCQSSISCSASRFLAPVGQARQNPIPLLNQ